MKLQILAIFALVVLSLTACQKPSSNETTVPANLNGNCVQNPSQCQNGVYQQTPGFYPYGYPQSGYNRYGSGYGYNYYGSSYYYNNGYYGTGASPFYFANEAAYLCSCPAGSLPTYNTYSGLGCIQGASAYGSGYVYFGWSAGGGLSGNGSNNNQWVNIPQISNYVGYQNSSCYNGVIQSCIVDQANTCSVGYTCRPSAAASRLGLCVSNTAPTDQPIYR